MSTITPVRPDAPRNGLPRPKPYIYQGTGEDTLTPPELKAQLDEQFGSDDEAPPATWPHGTHLGYERHRRAGETACAACRAANAARSARVSRRSRYRAAS